MAQEVEGSSPFYHPIFFALIPVMTLFFPCFITTDCTKTAQKNWLCLCPFKWKKINRLHFLIKVTPKIYSLLCLLFSRAGNHLSRAHAAKEIRIGFPERPENQSLLFWGLTFNRPYFSDEEAIKSRLQMPAKDSVQQFLAVDQHRTYTA